MKHPPRTSPLSPALLGGLLSIIISTASPALLTSETGNQPLSAGNYTDWPGLVEAINDKSRIHTVWCNGNEDFAYSGETADLNRVLEKFAATDVPELKIVMRPATGESIKIEGMQRPVSWRINIVGGIARAAITEYKIDSVWLMHPTLTVYVSDLIDLEELEIPRSDKLEVLQLADLRKRYQAAKTSQIEPAKKEAERNLEGLEAEAANDGDADAAKLYERRAKAIEKFLEARDQQ